MPINKCSFTKEDPHTQSLISAILNAKGIVLICGKSKTLASKTSYTYPDPVTCVGAGISVAAGIPDFRSKQQIPGVPESAKKKLKDMFQLSMIMDEMQRPMFGRFIAGLAEKASESLPTPFHKLLKTLDDRGTLVRVYTQNIDGLELKAGLPTYHRIRPEDDPQDSRCIAVHGDLQHVYCESCKAVEVMKPYHDTLHSGEFP
ncbi:DHS-like NAD/FAD-binding domain-containing protein, partial [Leucogyrophana mollusca]